MKPKTGYEDEFSTVELILKSGAETRGVDAFALSLIKAERQARRLLTFLVFQSPAFGTADGRALRKTLASSKQVFFAGLIAGIDALAPLTVRDLVGPEYDRLWARFVEFARHRNKIFHGQLTVVGVRRNQLLQNVHDIQLWCESLGRGGVQELGYDGFDRNSFRKSTIGDLSSRLRIQIGSHQDYVTFLRAHMERRNLSKAIPNAPEAGN